MKLLDSVNYPEDIKDFSSEELRQLADELREATINAVAKTGGHLGAGLGVIELTVAIHHVFNTPDDRLIWDVGHQAYPHKILTGRKDRIETLRKPDGLSGFTKRSESEYDPFGAGHSSTSISAGLGMAVARDRLGNENNVIAVIGDGAMSAGMAYEALNNAGDSDSKLIVILNDNDMSIAPPTGAMRAYLAKLISGRTYNKVKDFTMRTLKYLPESFEKAALKTEQIAKDVAIGGNFFEELGFNYIGPLDGHNLDHLLPVLKNAQKSKNDEPILIHIVTEKGKGFNSPESSKEKFHAVKTFDSNTKIQQKASGGKKSYTEIFADELIKLAGEDKKIVGITAAMPSGTGMNKFGDAFPERTYDVGIAEQHAVTFAAGLASEGIKPFCAIYSTFLQRGYDQLVHDVCIQNLPVRFAIDRAGLVGADGSTHAGSFDIAYLMCIPNIVIISPADEVEFASMIKTASDYDDGPIAFRFPRGEGLGLDIPEKSEAMEIGKARVVNKHDGEADVSIISFGTRLEEAKKARDQLESEGLKVNILDARFAKPFDEAKVTEFIKSAKLTITIEEGSIGGFGSAIQQFALNGGLLDGGRKLRSIFLPDEFIDHGKPEKMYEDAGLNASGIIDVVKKSRF